MGADSSRILVYGGLPDEALRLVSPYPASEVASNIDAAMLRERIAPFHGLVLGEGVKIDSGVIEAARELRVIACAGESMENLVLEAATRRGIVVVRAEGSAVSLAEFALAALLALARRLPEAHSSLRAGRWERSRFVGVQVRHRTLGLVGLGHTGAEVARRARGLNMRVVACDPFVSPQYASNLSADLLSLDDLMKTSDFVSLHVPLTAQTERMIGRRELGLLRPGAHLINCSDERIVDLEGVLEALESAALGGVAVDALPSDPRLADRLLRQGSAIVTPRLGGWTVESQREAAVEAVRDALNVLAGYPAKHAVNTLAVRQEEFASLGPYVTLAEQMGRLLGQLSEGCWRQIEMVVQGEIAVDDTAPLLSAAACGVLKKALPERANLANSLLLARSRGISLLERKDLTTPEKYSNLVTLRSPAPNFVDEVMGTVIEGRPYVVRLGRHWVNLAPTGGYLFLSRSADRPGIVGRVGTLLGEAGISFSSLQLGRRGPEGHALMVMRLDEPIPATLMSSLLEASSALDGRLVRF